MEESLLIWMPLLDAICYLDSTNADPHAETQFTPDSTLVVHSPNFSLGIQSIMIILANCTFYPKALLLEMEDEPI